MKRLLPIVPVLLAMASPAWGKWGHVPLEGLVADSDFVVVGTLADVVEFSDLTEDHGRGVITVDEVLWGGVSPGQRLVLAWDNRVSTVCPRVEHGRWRDHRGIWLLKLASTGHVRADYPWRFRKLSERAEVLRLLSTRPAGAAKPYVQTASVQDLLNADRPYGHYIASGVIAAALLAIALWWLAGRIGVRPLVRPRDPLACPYCQSEFKLTWRGLLLHPLGRFECPACSQRVKLDVRLRRMAPMIGVGVILALGVAYVAWFWGGYLAALSACVLASPVLGCVISKHSGDLHGRLLPNEKAGGDSRS